MQIVITSNTRLQVLFTIIIYILYQLISTNNIIWLDYWFVYTLCVKHAKRYNTVPSLKIRSCSLYMFLAEGCFTK